MKNFFGQADWQESYDWQQAFQYASGFDISDVALVMAAEEGENDGASWIMAGLLKDGRFFFLTAGCDYTGWDCLASGSSEVSDSWADLIRWKMGESDRDRLGIVLEDAT